jgi:hypothetical protein
LNTPSFDDRVEYLVPDGKWVAVTVAPTNGWPLLSVTLPFTLLVVTCAKEKRLAAIAKNRIVNLLSILILFSLQRKRIFENKK